MFNVSNFLEQQKIMGHSKPSYFEVYLAAPNITEDITNKVYSRMFCHASQIPGVVLNYTEIPYQGTLITIPTTRYFNEWSVTVTNDANFVMRTNLEKWVETISNGFGLAEKPALGLGSVLSFGRGKTNTLDLRNALQDVWVIHYSNALAPRPTAIYRMYDAFPADLSSIELDWGTNDSLEEYTVTFRYQYWRRITLNLGMFGGLGSALNSSAISEITSNLEFLNTDTGQTVFNNTIRRVLP